MLNAALAKKINLFVLLACVVLTVVMCPKKQLYFDEPFQIMESRGFALPVELKYDSLRQFTSADLNKENTITNVLNYSDSIHYVLLHYLTMVVGNGLSTYVWFSLFWAILALGTFYALGRLVVGDNVFTGVAIVLLFTNISFMAQAYSIRHYIMALFFVTVSAIYFFRYLFVAKSFKNLLLLGVFCAVSLVSHYFTFYIIVVYMAAILAEEKLRFFTIKNMVALALPVGLLLFYFHFHPTPFAASSHYQNYVKGQPMEVNRDMSFGNEFSLFLKSVSVNFQLLYPLFKDRVLVRVGSVVLLVVVYFYSARKLFKEKEERKKFNLVFAMGLVSSFFIAGLAMKTQNNMLFSYRYLLFSMPFCCLFVALLLKHLVENKAMNGILKMAVVVLMVGPGLFKFLVVHFKKHEPSGTDCSHLEVVDKIEKNDVHKVQVPDAVDAIFINSLLPAHYDMAYYTNPTNDTATLYYKNGTEKIALVRNSLIVLF